ncbi:Nuclear import receptor [Malassezia yamatoensis]|uniref:Nuclear import receptor n=1 Tax=Malassezia yamatoensis TaxID=253288 RepID=A0AAJ5YQZ4_9BASI|nr:Nuclear import receptor [Malassezia yamatoensis]
MSGAVVGGTDSTEHTLNALQQLYNDPDPSVKSGANEALQHFQKTQEAWNTANTLLLTQDLPLESRLFAAQTFRKKITFDLQQLPLEAQLSLRDTLLDALNLYARGPRVVQTQLCLAIAALALQIPESSWSNVVPSMVDRFGKSAETVNVLLEFLTVLPEEVAQNHRIPISNAAYHDRLPQLLTQQASLVLEMLSMYIQAEGATPSIQETVFHCLRSWLKAGEVTANQLASTPLVMIVFQALDSDALFDVAVDVLCDLIHETQEIDENQVVIQLLLPRIQALRPALMQAGDDEDRVRGLCRVFVQAGETYHTLALQHANELLPIVQAILECASYHDLDIVQITFRFWYLLATHVHKAMAEHNPSAEPFRMAYEQLFAIILRHLRFPDEELSGQERDDFRSFRHYMGDTLKDCCYVLGAETCLARSLQMIESALAEESPSLRWQDIEAPLFSMRSMGAQVDLREDQVIPRIFAIIPRLPPHPRLRYAGLLVLSRYTEWVEQHPERIPEVLTFITTGFDRSDKDISAAAAQAMNFLCQDCCDHLAPYFDQLLGFFNSVQDQLAIDDLLSIVEAIAHVIASMPPQDAMKSLMQFTQPFLEGIQQIALSPTANKPELMQAADDMEQLARILQVIGVNFASFMPDSCAATCSTAFGILDRLLEQHCHAYFISERTSALIRRALIFFGPCAKPTLPSLLQRFTSCFESTGYSGYVWIIGKSIDQFGHGADAELSALMTQSSERVSSKVMQLLHVSSPDQLSDVLDDYVHTCLVITQTSPQIMIDSPIFPHTVQVAVLALGAVSPAVHGVASDYLRTLFELPTTTEGAMYMDTIRNIAHDQGYNTCQALLRGLVTIYPPENMPAVVGAVKALYPLAPDSLAQWLAATAEQLPANAISQEDTTAFLESLRRSPLNAEQIKPSLVILYGASRKSRERARLDKVE